MKRIVTISAILLAVGYTVAARQAAAQPSSNKAQLDEAAKQYRAAEEHARKTAEASDDPQALRDKLRPLVEESFVARQKFQSAEVEMLGRRLAEITQAINDREKNRQAIIDARVDELLNPGRVSASEPKQRLLEIDLRQAQNLYVAAQEELTRMRQLHDTGSVTDKQLRAAEKKFSDSELEFGRARGNLERLVQPQAAPGAPLNPPSSAQSRDVPADNASATQATPTIDPQSPFYSGQNPPEAGYTIRYVHEQVVENGKPITRRRPVYEWNGKGTRPGPVSFEKVPATQHLPIDPYNAKIISQETFASNGSDLDLDTRERLARLELEEAIAKSDLAKSDFASHKNMNEKARGSTPKAEMRKLEAAFQLAQIGAKRAYVNIQGLARQRAELESNADAAIAEATAAQQKAAAGVRISEANREAAQAQLQKAEADLEAAESHQKYRDKQHQRIKKLVEERAVDEKLVDESEELLFKAKAALTGARSAVANAKANVDQTASAIDEAKAALKVADLRLLAAQAHRDRLKQRVEAKNSDPAIPTTTPAAEAP